MEDLQHSIIFYNYAVFLYYKKQYSDCYKIIDKLYYQFNELLDDKLFRELNFIFVDILIHLKKVYLVAENCFLSIIYFVLFKKILKPLKALVILQNCKVVNRRSSSQLTLPNETNNENEAQALSTVDAQLISLVSKLVLIS